MPRLAQALSLDFGAPVFADLAVPFATKVFAGRRVAIVDDVVNVGSTMDEVRSTVESQGASQVRLFAIGFRSPDQAILSSDDVEIINPEALGDARSAALSAEVPRLLRGLARPYDLDFPVIGCAALPPFSDMVDASRGLADCFGASQTRDVTSWHGQKSGVCRISVEVPDAATGWLTKLRLYGRPDSPEFWVVPMAVPPALSWEMLPLKDPLWLRLTESLTEESRHGEPGIRAAMFSYSLAFGLHAIERARSVLQLTEPDLVFNREEAAFAFGPTAVTARVPQDHAVSAHPAGLAPVPELSSPFFAHATQSGLVAAIASKAGCSDPGQLFEAVFSVLSQQVGADDPASYRLGWPYSLSEVMQRPYLRLRIGPTWTDLTRLVRSAAHQIDGDRGVARCSDLELSTALDRYVDGGSVVPTFARYDDTYYRVYRKGETDPHEEIAERVGYAWAAYGRPLSMTRATKILTVLGLAPGSDVPFAVGAIQRGNVACMPRSVLDDDAELTRYLRDTGRLRYVKPDKKRLEAR